MAEKRGALPGGNQKRKAYFLPVFEQNPYQRLLGDHLKPHDVEVIALPRRTLFLMELLKTATRKDVLHIHWPKLCFLHRNWLLSLLKLCFLATEFILVRLRGLKIIWTIHEPETPLYDHLFLDRLCSRILIRIANAFIVHSRAGQKTISGMFPSLPPEKLHVIPHGNYIGVYPDQLEREEARGFLGIPEEKVVFLFLGHVRAYKGVPELVRAFTRSGMSKKGILLIAGHVDDPQYSEELDAVSVAHPNIKIAPYHLAPGDVELFLKAADVSVFPFRKIFTSGSVILAMSHAKAIIAPRMGDMVEILNEKGAFLYDPKESDGLVNCIRMASEKCEDLAQMGAYNRRCAEEVPWKKIAEATFSLYHGRV